jgi:hypothetical protein
VKALRVVPVPDPLAMPSPEDMRHLAAKAKLETLKERAAIEQQFGVKFDPTRDGELLRDRRTK